MCGFLLVLSSRSGVRLPFTHGELDRLRDTLVHRGPDAGETWTDAAGTVALTHRRLKVLDLAGSRQPMASPDGRHHLLFNGEIYNFRQLRAELAREGWSFRTTGDTEVLLAAWVTWGRKALTRLEGMFAFAIWDAAERRLDLVRDPLGIKPLCYGSWDGRFYAASEPKAILSDPRVPRAIDPEAVDLYFHHGYVPAPWSIWRGMRKLEAACHLAYEPDRAGSAGELPRPRRYWELPLGRVAPERFAEPELLERLDETLQAAVERQTVSDVPLGAFLSGGVDSTLVVAYLARHSDQPVRTFSVGYADERFDERVWARRVSERYGTIHHELLLDHSALEQMDGLAEAHDEPFADPAALPLAALCRLARQHVTVALSGDGGDETHAGYPRYLAARRMRWLDRVPLGVRRATLGRLAELVPSWKRRGVLEQASRDAADRYDAMTAEVPWSHRWTVYADPMRRALGAVRDAGPGASSWRREIQLRVAGDRDPLDVFQHVDMATYLPEQLLVKTDRASMHVSLEARVPLLDVSAIELAARIPAGLRVRDGRPKYLRRKLVERRMGPEHAHRRKHGFRVPELAWFRRVGPGELEARLASPGLADWLEPDRLRAFLLESPRGHEFLWPFLAFAAWHRRWVGLDAAGVVGSRRLG
jgi:asparagine synthase (glutamine-hydrolysing)